MRLFVPSWVIPGTYLENVRFLEGKDAVSGVELLFFTDSAENRALLAGELPLLASFKRRFDFTVHLPSPLTAELLPLVRLLHPLVSHFIIHPEADAVSLASLLTAWYALFGTEKFVIENVSMDEFENALSCLPGDVPLCMDTGHILREGGSVIQHFKKYRRRLKEIHLHDTDEAAARRDGRLADHRALRKESAWFSEFMPLLNGYTGIVNLEVFSWREIEESLAVLR